MTFSSQHHSFDISIASQYGIESAILIHHFQHWIRINRFAKRNIKEGRCWTYQTRKEIQAHFPYWSFEEVRYLCEKLVRMGVLITNNFNKSKVDKTLWYGFVDEADFGVDEESSKKFYEREKSPSRGKSPFPEGKSPTPIPDPIPDPKAKEEEREGAKPPVPPSPLFSYKRVKMDQFKMDSLVKDFGKLKIQEMLERLDEYADLNPKKFRSYGCHGAVIRKWIREDKQSAPKTSQNASGSTIATIESDNRLEAYKLKRENFRLFNQHLIDDFNVAFWEFPKLNSSPVKIYYKDPRFVELIKHEIKKILDNERF